MTDWTLRSYSIAGVANHRDWLTNYTESRTYASGAGCVVDVVDVGDV